MGKTQYFLTNSKSLSQKKKNNQGSIYAMKTKKEKKNIMTDLRKYF